VDLTIPLPDGLALRIADDAQSADTAGYPTRQLQKGFVVLDGGEDLAEEGVGFGVPILKRGVQTVFPGSLELGWHREGVLWEVTAAYGMNLVERLARQDGRRVRSRPLMAAKDSLAALHRRVPALRGPLTATSRALRRAFGWETTYDDAGFEVAVTVTYVVDSVTGAVRVAVDLSGLQGAEVSPARADGLPGGFTSLVVMNELGAHHFDRYADSDGADLRGPEIGTWDEVGAAQADFVCAARRVAFSLGQAERAALHRGRELIDARLAWAGFGYSLSPPVGRFAYDMTIGRTT
jgi:hypothetical protein